MRVAVYAPALTSEQGGVSTLEHDIFNTLLKLAPSSKYEFLIYTQSARDLSLNLPANVRIVDLERDSVYKIALMNLLNKVQDRLLDRRPFHFQTWFEKSLRKEKAQLVYYTTNRFEPCNQPYIYTVLDIENFIQPGYPEVTANGEFERRADYYRQVCPKATYVISANEAGKEQIVRHLHIEADRVLPLPYVAPNFAREGKNVSKDPGFRKKYSLVRDFVFYPAKCYPHKNHVGLLYAIKSLQDRHGIKLDIVFSGPDGGNRAHVENVAKSLRLEDVVHFLGFIPVEDVVQLYKHAVVMTYMSHFGPSNIPSLEAFALGCPVINSRVTGAEEELSDAAILVDPTDQDALADAIAKVYQDERFQSELIQRGLIRAEKWKIEDYVHGVFSLLDRYEKVRRCWA